MTKHSAVILNTHKVHGTMQFLSLIRGIGWSDTVNGEIINDGGVLAMTDVKDNLEYLLNKYELVENGIPAMGDLRTTRDKFKQAILEEMDRVIADLIGDDEQIKPWLGDAGGIRNIHRANLRRRWQEVRGEAVMYYTKKTVTTKIGRKTTTTVEETSSETPPKEPKIFSKFNKIMKEFSKMMDEL